MQETNSSYEKQVTRISSICMGGNILLTIFKFIAGILGRSYAMISDAVHSSSDVLGSLIILVGVRLSGKAPDEDHPYGHERFESIASILLALILFATGIEIAKTALSSLIHRTYLTKASPGAIALIASIVSIVLKEAMYQYAIHGAKRLSSSSLRAEAWHHRSDALSSVGALIGIYGARAGYPLLDPLACLVISIPILKTAFDILREGTRQVTDHACPPELEQEILACILADPDVKGVDLLHTREFGRQIYVDLEVEMDGSLTLMASHEKAELLHDLLEEHFPRIKHVMIHVNPV